MFSVCVVDFDLWVVVFTCICLFVALTCWNCKLFDFCLLLFVLVAAYGCLVRVLELVLVAICGLLVSGCLLFGVRFILLVLLRCWPWFVVWFVCSLRGWNCLCVYVVCIAVWLFWFCWARRASGLFVVILIRVKVGYFVVCYCLTWVWWCLFVDTGCCSCAVTGVVFGNGYVCLLFV